jgi:ATP-binding protein involved in chromosome partitioning
MSRRVVARSARLLRESGVAKVALVANMADHVCDACGHTTPLYEDDGTEALAAETGIEIWASIPFDRRLAAATDSGRPWLDVEPDSASARAFGKLAARVEREWLPAGAAP